MSSFRSMGCEIVLPDEAPVDGVKSLFDERDRRFSRFIENSEVNRVNALPLGVALVSEDMASMLAAAFDAAHATGGLVTPAVGGALLAAGYDRDFADLPADRPPAETVSVVPSLETVSLRGRMLLRTEPLVLDLNGVVKGRTVDDALARLGAGWVSAGGDLAATTPVEVGLPGGGSVIVYKGGLATSSTGVRSWRRGGVDQHHLIDPATGRPARTPWRDVTVAAGSCLASDVAAKAALLLGVAGPSWLDRRGLAGRFVDTHGVVTINESWRAALPGTLAA